MPRVNYGRHYYRTVYLKSDEWRNIREGIIRSAEGMCEKCRVSRCTDVHHMNYGILNTPHCGSRLFLIALCRPCHNLIEKAKKIRLLQNAHTREDLLRITVEMVKNTEMFRRKKTPWDTNLTMTVSQAGIRAKKLVCGVMKLAMPHRFSEWEGILLTQAQRGKIRFLLNLPDFSRKQGGPSSGCVRNKIKANNKAPVVRY